MSITRKLLLTSEIIFYKYPHFLTNVIAMLIRQAYKIRRFGPTCPHCSLRMLIGWDRRRQRLVGGPDTSGRTENRSAIPRDNNETYLQHPNLLGSTTQDTDHLGNWTEDLLWYPWGQLWQTAGSTWEYQWAAFQSGDGDFKRGLVPHLRRLGRSVDEPRPAGGRYYQSPVPQLVRLRVEQPHLQRRPAGIGWV